MNINDFIKFFKVNMNQLHEKDLVLKSFEQLELSESLIESFTVYDKTSYHRSLICKNDYFELRLMCWLPDQETLIHDHADSNCIVKVQKGNIENRIFCKLPSEYNTSVHLVGNEILKEDEIHQFKKDTIHQISNYTDIPALTLHLYYPPLGDVSYFDETMEENISNSIVIKFQDVSIQFDSSPEYLPYLPSRIGMEMASTVINFLEEHKPDKVLDIGSGAGHLAILAGIMGARDVVATDIDETALIITQRNWIINGLNKNFIRTIHSDLFKGLNEHEKNTFDLVICNPPQLPSDSLLDNEPDDPWYYAGSDGRKIIDGVIQEAIVYLKPGGTLLISGRSHTNWSETKKILSNVYGCGNWSVLNQVDVPFKKITKELTEYLLKKQKKESSLRIYHICNDESIWHHKLYIVEAIKKFNQTTIGIMGGMGAEAGVLLSSKIVNIEAVSTDNEHIPFILFNNTNIPNCSASVQGGKNSVAELVRTAQKLENSGADVIGIACHTAHTYLNEIRNSISIPVLGMIDISLLKIVKEFGAYVKIGLLASNGTVKIGIYQKTLKLYSSKAEIFLPKQQSNISEATHGSYGIKAGYKNERVHNLLNAEVEELFNRGVNVVLAACTEIPLVLECHEDLDIKTIKSIIDPMDLLAKELVLYARRAKA